MPSTSNLCVEAITPHLGAVVRGLALGAKLDAGDLERIVSLLARHLVLVFEDQRLNAPSLRDFVAHFGPLFHHHADEGVLYVDGIPEVLQIRRDADGERLFGGSDWHADVTFRRPGGYISALQAITVPPLGGDTGFASTVAAFASLSAGMQSFLRGLSAVHSYDGPGRPDHPTQTAVHPVVRRHPTTGAEGLYLNRMFVTRFEGWTTAESRALIDFLDRHMTRPEVSARVRWKTNQLVMWDNRFTLHYPINDFSGHRRLLYRCTALECDA